MNLATLIPTRFAAVLLASVVLVSGCDNMGESDLRDVYRDGSQRIDKLDNADVDELNSNGGAGAAGATTTGDTSGVTTGDTPNDEADRPEGQPHDAAPDTHPMNSVPLQLILTSL